MSTLTLTWLGHACFKAEFGGYAIVLDPYAGVQGYSPLTVQAHAVLCSHGHGDHAATGAVELLDPPGPSPFQITRLSCYHDDRQGELRGQNTVHILEAGGLRAVHLGDLGHIPSEEHLALIRGCHALMVPVGGHYTLDPGTAKRLTDLVQPRVCLPIHYRRGPLGFDVLAHLSDFLDLADDVVEYGGNRIDIDADTPAQTAVLRYMGPEGGR